jgi:LexA-binding, inner membrane-associated putative hydrolase
LFAVGHMALGYLLGKASAKSLKVKPNIPLLLVLSIIPDIDILAGEDFHRRATHSVILAIIVFIPFIIYFGRRAVPYMLALVSHALIADLIVGGGIQLWWPLSTKMVYLPAPFPYISINSTVNVALELTLFTLATILMFKTKDSRIFLESHRSNLLLAIPIFTVLLPTFTGYPLTVPLLLIPPHLFYIIVFSIAVLSTLWREIVRLFPKGDESPPEKLARQTKALAIARGLESKGSSIFSASTVERFIKGKTRASTSDG